MTRLRVASYNTHDLLDDRLAAASVVRALDPDVLCLQEVPRRLLATTRVATFAAECGMYWGGDHRGSGGTTILTALRVDVAESVHRRLRVHWPDRTRGYAMVRLRLPGRPDLVVVSLHLGLRADERARHADTLLEDLATERSAVLPGGDVLPGEAAPGGVLPGGVPRGDGAPPGAEVRPGRGVHLTRTVVCGDLNEDETAMGPGTARHTLAGAGLRLVSPADPTFPARAPRRRLDVVLATPDVDVLPHREVDLPHHLLAAASDHRPVWADLSG